MEHDTLKKIARWGVSDDTGLSSRFLASCIIGEPVEEKYTPADPADFARCFRLAELVSSKELDEALELAATKSKKWKIVADNWNELASMFLREKEEKSAPLLYKRMKELGL